MRWITHLKQAAAMIPQKLGQSILTFGWSQGNEVLLIVFVQVRVLPQSPKGYLGSKPFT